MNKGIHFISGLPRSGSTLLSGILRQNPRFHAHMSSPVAALFGMAQTQLSGRSEFYPLISDDQRRDVLKGLFDSYYKPIHPEKVVFDTNRAWTAKVSALNELFPEAKIICCVRSTTWIVDSFERLIQSNGLEPSRITGFNAGGSIYSRVENLTGPKGPLGSALSAFKEAYYGEHARKLLVIPYESLVRAPAGVMNAVYDFLGEERFEHDFDNVEIDVEEFDRRFGLPGLHTVRRKVEYKPRQTIVPLDISARFSKSEFWMDPRRNPRGVAVLALRPRAPTPQADQIEAVD